MLTHQLALADAFRKLDAKDNREESTAALAATLGQITTQVFALLYPALPGVTERNHKRLR